MRKLDLKNMSLNDRVKYLTTMIEDRMILQAFEKFYAEDVTIQSIEKGPINGKDRCRKLQEDFVTGLIDYKKAKVVNSIISENKSMVEWELEYTHEKYGHQTMSILTVQCWNNDGEIINEKYYYSK
nr:hypothetical protein [uncultured Carboxylicivirga sp.]